MPLTFARRGHCVFRHLSLRVTDPVSARVSPVPSYFRRVSQLTSLRPHYLATFAKSSTNRFILRKTYATAASRPKAHTGKAKAGAGPKKATKSTTAKESTSRAKKQLTPKQKEKKDAEKRTADIKELKEISLKEPKALPRLAWSLFVADKLKGSTTPVKERLKAVVSQYRSLSEDELEAYQRQAQANLQANTAAYAAWVESHTPIDIRKANLARKRLAVLTANHRYPTKLVQIKDERQVKRPRPPYIMYTRERFDSGDLKHMPLVEATGRIAQEWKGLTEQEKKKYERLHEQDTQRYIQEYRAVYGEDPYLVKSATA